MLAAVLVAACAPPAAAAPPADIADLFPPGTLAFAEVTNPAEFAPELAAVFKGTALEDSIPFVHARKDAAGNLLELYGTKYLALLGLLAAPEMTDELKKLRFAVGLTGFTGSGEPEFVVAVLTHDSPAAGLAARAYLTLSPTLRKVGEVSKVAVFQHRSPNVNHDNNGVPVIDKERKPSDGPHEPTFAYTPGLFVAGSSKAAIGHVVRRFGGEEKGGGLSAAAGFKDAAGAHRKTGVFFYVDFPELTARMDAANRARGDVRGVEQLIPGLAATGLDALDWFKLTANAKAVKSVAGNVRFRDGGLSLSVAATFDPSQKSPLLDFLSGPGVKVELLHHARRPASFAVGVALPEKNRSAALLGFLDAIAKANGTIGRLPGEAVREMEQKYKVAITGGLLAKTRAVTVMLPTKQDLPKGASAMPMVVLHTEDAATATAWEEFFPKLFGDLAGAATPPNTSAETIDGVRVFSLPGTGLPWNAPVHYARGGSVVSVGLDRKLVAQSVAANAAASVAGGNAAVSPPAAGTAAVGVVSLGDVLLKLIDRPKPDGPVVPKDIEDGPVFLPNGNPLPDDFMENLKKAKKAFVESLAALPPATLTAKRNGNELQVELFQPKVQGGGLKAVIDAAAAWLDKAGGMWGTDRHGRFDQFERFGKW